MRWYMIAFWIFLTLSVSHSTLAAPVAVGETVEVRSNPVRVLNDGIAALEKRMGPNDKDQSSRNNVQLPGGGAPGGVQEGVDVQEKGVPGWKRGWPWNSGPDSGGPDPSTNNPPKEASGGGGGVSGQNWRWPWESEQLGSSSRGPGASTNTPPNNPPKVASGGGGGVSGQKWRWPWESEQLVSGSTSQNNPSGGSGSAENMSPGPQSEDPANPIVAILDKWIK